LAQACKLPLRIKPVFLKQSVYFRVPSTIAGLIEGGPDSQVTLRIKEQDEQFLLIYSVEKSQGADKAELTIPMQMLAKSSTRKCENE
jgi:hypothetical protein